MPIDNNFRNGSASEGTSHFNDPRQGSDERRTFAHGDKPVVEFTYHIPKLHINTLTLDQFNAPGPHSPTADLGRLHLSDLSESNDVLRSHSCAYLRASMQTQLKDIRKNAGSHWMPMDDVSFANVFDKADKLLEAVNGTVRDDSKQLKALCAQVVRFLDEDVLPNLDTTIGGVRRFTDVGATMMGRLRFFDKFDSITVAGARNRIQRSGQSARPQELIAAATRRLSDMTHLLMAMHGGDLKHLNIAVAMFRIGQADDGAGTIEAISGTLVATSDNPAHGTDDKMQGYLDRIRDGDVTKELTLKYPEAIEALKDATVVLGDLLGELNAATPTLPLLMRTRPNHKVCGATDAEYRLLANILHEIRRQNIDPEQATGHVYLFTQKPIGGSSMQAVEAFEKKCPKFAVIVTQGRMRYQSADETLSPGVELIRCREEPTYRLDESIELQTGSSPAVRNAALSMRNVLQEMEDPNQPFDQSAQHEEQLLDAIQTLVGELNGRARDSLSFEDRKLLNAVSRMLDTIAPPAEESIGSDDFELDEEMQEAFNWDAHNGQT